MVYKLQCIEKESGLSVRSQYIILDHGSHESLKNFVLTLPDMSHAVTLREVKDEDKNSSK